MLEPREQSEETLSTAGPGEQIPGHDDEVRPALRDPVDRVLDGANAARGDSQMEIREMGDPQAVELCGQAVDGELELPQAHPTGLEPAPARRGGREPGDRDEWTPQRYEVSRSRTG